MHFLKTYFSPFKPLKLDFYIGRIAIGTPYYYPRKIVKNKAGVRKFVDKKIGFDFVDLGWKTKWNDADYRFEWSPIWSFVFFKWQIAITFVAPHLDHYWECWLHYTRNTDKSKTTKQRIKQARKHFPCVWHSYRNGQEEKICYWDLILKKKYI